MAINSSLTTIFSTVSPTPSLLKALRPSNTSLINRINWMFGLYVGYLIGGVSCCLYYFYQTYQLKQHTCFGLDDRFKLAKCQALLDEAQEKDFNKAQPFLQQCESLLNSITDKLSFHDKERIFLKLALYYSKNDPLYSYYMTKHLSSSSRLFKVAQDIQKNYPNFDSGNLERLFVQALEVRESEDKKPNRFSILSLDLQSMLEFAKAFHSLKTPSLVDRCMTHALNLINGDKNASIQFRCEAFCQIAQCYQEIGNSEQMRVYIESAQQLFKSKIDGFDMIKARLILADTFYSILDFERVDQELIEVITLMGKDEPLKRAKNLYPLAKLFSKIKKNEQFTSIFKGAEFENLVEGLIEKVLQDLDHHSSTARTIDLSKEMASHTRINAYLTIASIYQEKLLNKPAEKNTELDNAFQEIQSLPDKTEEELNSKIKLLVRLSFYEKNQEKARKVMQCLEGFYDRCPVEINHPSHLLYEKLSFGKQILRLYNQLGLKDESNTFFQKYLFDLKNQKDKDIFSKINELVVYADIFDNHQNHEQIKAQLQAAEAILPQITSSLTYEHALSIIIKGYINIDRQIGLNLLEKYENQQARSCRIIAIAIPVFMGFVHIYPEAGSILSLGALALKLWILR